MAGSRANWEGMVGAVKSAIDTFTKKPAQEKAEVAAEKLGTGLAGKAVGTIMNRKKELEQQTKDAGI
jgi:hypothetical protein